MDIKDIGLPRPLFPIPHTCYEHKPRLLLLLLSNDRITVRVQPPDSSMCICLDTFEASPSSPHFVKSQGFISGKRKFKGSPDAGWRFGKWGFGQGRLRRCGPWEHGLGLLVVGCWEFLLGGRDPLANNITGEG